MTTRHSRFVGVVSVLALAVAACGGDDDSDDDATATPTDAPADDPPADPDPDEPDEPAGGPIRIGMLSSLTGPFTPWGVQVRDGMQLAIDEINADGGVDGRQLELVAVDDQSNPEEGVNGIERLIEGGAVAVAGVISSDVGLAAARIAEELETPLFLVKAGSEAILERDSRYTFRTCLPAATMVAGPIAQYAEREGLERVGAIIADYAWGQAIRGALEDEFAALDGIELQIEVAPVPEQDFITYLRSIDEFGPDMIVATGHPPGSGGITVQSADLGLDVPITGAYSPLATVMSGAGDAAVNRYSDFGCADYESDGYQDLARRYLESSDNPFMEDDAVAGYGVVQMVAEAVAAVGDDPAAIADYLHGATFDLPGYAFEVSWTEWGELAAAQPLFAVIGPGPAPDGVNDAGDWYPETLLLPEPLTPYEP